MRGVLKSLWEGVGRLGNSKNIEQLGEKKRTSLTSGKTESILPKGKCNHSTLGSVVNDIYVVIIKYLIDYLQEWKHEGSNTVPKEEGMKGVNNK